MLSLRTLLLTLLLGSYLQAQEQYPHSRPTIPSAQALNQLPADGGPKWNRLVFQSSPYLLQHAANPVDWYPWGDEAFNAAQKLDKPIFLSIGYSTCHWCHVMERESFQDQEVAALLNQYFVCVKVDREERPDIDDIYMTACQLMTGSGGWPLTAVLNHRKEPFFVGTYFPKKALTADRGMMTLLPAIYKAWTNDRDKLDEMSQKIVEALAQDPTQREGTTLDQQTMNTAFKQLSNRYDPEAGGFNTSPKFPTPHNLTFLLRHYKRTGDAKALEMVRHTLLNMRRGGIFDHVGYGFHRYATDQQWLVPHFEKMLYDQALLAIAYLETYQATREPEFAQTAREIFTYVLRDMTSPEGGFFSAEDADSEGEEGKFYFWTPAEIIAILGETQGKQYNAVFNITAEGNFKEPTGQPNPGHNIVHLKKPLDAIAAELGTSRAQLDEDLRLARQRLFAARKKRVHPLKDDKILTDWNGLMIAALAKGGRILEEPQYTQAAVKAANFITTKLRNNEGRLLKRYRGGKAGLPAHLADYSFVTWGLIELYFTTFKQDYLQQALALSGETLNYFWDHQHGGFFLTAHDGEQLLTRSKKIYDGALPSGNSVAAFNMIRLARLTGDTHLEQQTADLFKAFSSEVDGRGSASTQLMNALSFALGPSNEVVIVGNPQAADTRAMISALYGAFIPEKVVLFKADGDNDLARLAPFLANHESLEGKATAYVCRNFSCKKPTSEINRMLADLKEP